MGEAFDTEQMALLPLTVKIVEKGMFSEAVLGSTEVELESHGLCKDKEVTVDVTNTKENGEKDAIGSVKLILSIEGK